MLYYLSIEYSRVSEEDIKNNRYDMCFYEKEYPVVGKRVTRPHYHLQSGKSNLKPAGEWQEESEYRNHKVTVKQYIIPAKEFEMMEEKPDLARFQKGNNTKGKKTFMDGWEEIHNDDDSTTIYQFLLK